MGEYRIPNYEFKPQDHTYCHGCGIDWGRALQWDNEALNYCPTCGNLLESQE